MLFERYSFPHVSGDLYMGEAMDVLSAVDDDTADILFLDPPFNLGKRYGASGDRSDQLPEGDYESWMCSVLSEGVRVLRPGGALYLYHLPRWALKLGSVLDDRLDLRHWISVAMMNGFARGRRLYPAHYALLYFTKGEPAQFSRPKLLPASCRHCGGMIKDYGGYRHIIEEKGINLSDVWTDVSPVRHSSRKRRTANELPSVITERVLEISGREGGLFVDPFAGTGTAVVQAVQLGMRFVANDIEDANCRLIAARLAQLVGDEVDQGG